MPPRITAFALGATLAACGSIACPTGYQSVAGACVVTALDGGGIDSGPRDAAIDAGMPDGNVDAYTFPCGHACTGTTPICDMGSHTCVACVSNMDCTTATASRCDTTTAHACAPCTADNDCSQISGMYACNAGTCVACTPANESACGANSCNPTTNTCTTTPRMSAGTCHGCAADSECMSAMDRCVPMQFNGMAHGSYCLRQFSAGCSRPYGTQTPARVSTSGAAAAMYCGVDESMVSCEAVNALVAGASCTTDMSCNAAGGLCRTVSGMPLLCTYACGTATDCPTGKTCNAGYCGS